MSSSLLGLHRAVFIDLWAGYFISTSEFSARCLKFFTNTGKGLGLSQTSWKGISSILKIATVSKSWDLKFKSQGACCFKESEFPSQACVGGEVGGSGLPSSPRLLAIPGISL